VPAFILGDSAYPNQKRILPTFKTTECDKSHIIRRLNRKLASARYSIENAFGLCKGRFGILNQELQCAAKDNKRAVILVTAFLQFIIFLLMWRMTLRSFLYLEPAMSGLTQRKSCRLKHDGEQGSALIENTRDFTPTYPSD
jgi:DDE superfamily endonuclease